VRYGRPGLGQVEGLRNSLAGADAKLDHMEPMLERAVACHASEARAAAHAESRHENRHRTLTLAYSSQHRRVWDSMAQDIQAAVALRGPLLAAATRALDNLLTALSTSERTTWHDATECDSAGIDGLSWAVQWPPW
jgi:hypothetical protein